jgi:hypothetical protein
MEADQTLNGSTVYRQIDEAKKLANRYEDDAEVQEETRLWQTRLQSVASENRTSISREATRVYQPSGPVQLAGPRMRRRWLPLALGASLAVAASTFFVGKTVLQTRQHQAEMKPARDLHAAVVKPKTSAGEKSVAPAEATSEPQAPKPAESETQTKGAAPLGIPTNPPEPPPAETSSPKTAISESPNASPVPSAVPMVKKPTVQAARA